MLGFISRMFGGSKSEKDVKAILPLVSKINQNFQSYQSLSNDALRHKTIEFRTRIQEHIKDIDTEIREANARAEALPFTDLVGKDTIYQEVDSLKKDRDGKIGKNLVHRNHGSDQPPLLVGSPAAFQPIIPPARCLS